MTLIAIIFPHVKTKVLVFKLYCFQGPIMRRGAMGGRVWFWILVVSDHEAGRL